VTEVPPPDGDPFLVGLVAHYSISVELDPNVHTVSVEDVRTALARLCFEVYLYREVYVDLNVTTRQV
jgi:hypothetical protein